MRNAYLIALFLFCAHIVHAQANRMTYWFDNDRDKVVQVEGLTLTTDLDASGLRKGAHILHIQAEGESNSPVYSALFIKAEASDMASRSADRMTYWFDNDRDKAVQVEGLTLTTDLDASGLRKGAHILHIQAEGESNSPVYSALFIKPFEDGYLDKKVTNLRYWFDNDYEKAITVEGASLIADIDISSLRWGAHILHVQGIGNNVATPVCSTPLVYMPDTSKDATFEKICYVFDDNATGHTADVIKNGDGYLCLLDAADLEIGAHTITAAMLTSDHRLTDWQTATFERIAMEACPMPEICFDGQYITLVVRDGFDMYFTLDGSQPTVDSILYAGEFDAGGIVTVKAVATHKELEALSDVAVYTTPAYFDGRETAIVEEPGEISVAFGRSGKADIESLSVFGSLANQDLIFLREMPDLRHLDLAEAQVEAIDNGMMQGNNLISVTMPREIGEIGSEIFSDSRQLAAIVWLSDKVIPDNALGVDNPCLLLYVNDEALAPEGVVNVVVNGHAGEIVLVDGARSSFFCPIPFIADRIYYTHQYEQQTPIGGSSGWESISLPFDVQRVEHTVNGEAIPFAARDKGDYDALKLFWLDRMGDGEFVRADIIEAYTPYIISMPNNPSYYPTYNLNGEVLFMSENVEISRTPTVERTGLRFETAFAPTDGDNIYALNVGEEFEGNPAGSVFVKGLRDVHAFEAYLTDSGASSHKPLYRISDLNNEGMSGIPMIASEAVTDVYATDGVLYIHSGCSQSIDIYSITGTLIRRIEVEEGLTTIHDLSPGFYIVDSPTMLKAIKVLINK